MPFEPCRGYWKASREVCRNRPACWRIEFPEITLYLCDAHHAAAELDWADRGTPRQTRYQEFGFLANGGPGYSAAPWEAWLKQVVKRSKIDKQLALNF